MTKEQIERKLNEELAPTGVSVASITYGRNPFAYYPYKGTCRVRLTDGTKTRIAFADDQGTILSSLACRNFWREAGRLPVTNRAWASALFFQKK